MSERPLCGNCPDCLARTHAILRPEPTLRDRVVALAKAGKTTAAIADALGITPAAAATHKSRARKLGAL